MEKAALEILEGCKIIFSDNWGGGTKEVIREIIKEKEIIKEPTVKGTDTRKVNKDTSDKQGDLSGITGAVVGSSGLGFLQEIFITLLSIIILTSLAWFISRRK